MSFPRMTSVTLTLEDDRSDPEKLEEDAQQLVQELAELHGAEVDRVSMGTVPPSARAGMAVEVAAMVVALGSGRATVPMLVALLRDWLGRRSSGSVRLKIGADEVELDRVPTSLQQQVLEEFLDRHRG